MGNFSSCCCEREKETCQERETCDEKDVQRNEKIKEGQENWTFGPINFRPADDWNRDTQFKRLYEQL